MTRLAWNNAHHYANCLECNTSFNCAPSVKRKFCSQKCYWDNMTKRRGTGTSGWKGGITEANKKERMLFHNTIRKEVLQRDNYTCTECSIQGGRLQVDHIKSWATYPHLRFKYTNCRTLCEGCHYKITFGKSKPSHVLLWGINLKNFNKQVRIVS